MKKIILHEKVTIPHKVKTPRAPTIPKGPEATRKPHPPFLRTALAVSDLHFAVSARWDTGDDQPVGKTPLPPEQLLEGIRHYFTKSVALFRRCDAISKVAALT